MSRSKARVLHNGEVCWHLEDTPSVLTELADIARTPPVACKRRRLRAVGRSHFSRACARKMPLSCAPKVTPMELIRRFGANAFVEALSSWAWLDGLAGMTPALANAFGDVFLQGRDGSFSFLDTVGGRLDRFWLDAASLQADINNPEAQDKYLMVGLAQAADSQGLTPGVDQVLSFKVPPVLGGQLSTENLELVDFVIAVNLAGQIHQQVKSLPPGTPIPGLTLD